MSKTLFLNFQNNQILEGFRKCDEFLLRHNNTLNMLSDERWRENKYMNTEKNISSPTNLIIGRYICNVLSALLIDLSMGVYSNIFVECQNKDGLDSYSKYIFSVLDFVTNINIKYVELSNLVQDTQTISADLMRSRIKRGLYDSFTYEDSILYKIYSIYCSIFENDKISLTEIENLFLSTEDKYESWLLQKILINLGVREGDKQLVEKYLLELEKNNVSKYDYWNSYSFYLLYFSSKESSTNYLSKKLDVDRFLNNVDIDYAESLVFKNYAAILEDDLIKRN
ncbi:hypothetical protein [Streptococcus sp. NLN64]|uniref:hypothetical protein n=1 Tax=Streptococcus sp. NLN64 TaxID=2822799 RepID=UPI0018CA48D2|nr:hypothetical protein [Streptococcus sp. NLN64]MBG9367858.1 hypothetical protein [Streptococcus sp. NLN64]